MERTAIISLDGKYRYHLSREWDVDPFYNMVFVMLNPSTADAEVDDATIRRCISFAQREGCSRLDVVNLFAYRSTKPEKLLEDVDVFHATRSRDAEYNEVSLSGLLNALDGVATPQGLITVMTTNNLEVLDEALTRPGRVDVMEHIGYLDSYQVEMLFDRFWPRRGDLGKDLETTLVKKVEAGMNLTPAIIVEAFKREPHNFTLAHATILEMEKERWKD